MAPSPKCVFCPSTAHCGSQCPKYDALTSRISRILELKRCYVCLNEHSADFCRNPAANDCRLCNERHHIGFSPEQYRTDNKASSDDEVRGETKDILAENHDAHAVVSDQHNGSHQSTLLEYVEVTVAHPTDKARRCQSVLVFDSCSTQTFIQRSLQEKLQLPQLNTVKLSIGTFMSSKDKTDDTFFTQLKIRKSNCKTFQIRAPAMDKLCGDVKSVFIKPQQVSELREGTCALFTSTETPEILIGKDLRHLFEVSEEHEPPPSGYVLSHTNVGSVIVGRGLTKKPTSASEVKTFFIRGVAIEPKQVVCLGQLLNTKISEKLKDILQQVHSLVLHADAKPEQPAKVHLENILLQMHSLEEIGVEPPDAQNVDDAIHKRIRDSIRWGDGRYEVGLPWRTTDGKAPSNADLPDNFAYAFACLRALIKTLSKSPKLLSEYDKIFKKYLASELVYDELEIRDEASAQRPKEASDVCKIKAEAASITDANLRKAYEIDGRVIMVSSGPIPLLDSHLHVDEVASYAETRRATPSTYATWSRDEAIGQSHRFAEYITVFCRSDTFLSKELVCTASESTSYPFSARLKACVGVHPGNIEDRHQRADMRQQLASIPLRAPIGQYHIVELGECGLDYTKKAPVRNADGSVKMRNNGSAWLSHSTIEKRKHQMPVFEGQMTLAKQLGRPDGRSYPLVLHLRDVALRAIEREQMIPLGSRGVYRCPPSQLLLCEGSRGYC